MAPALAAFVLAWPHDAVNAVVTFGRTRGASGLGAFATTLGASGLFTAIVVCLAAAGAIGATVWAAVTYAPAGTDRVIAVLVSAAGFLGLSWAGVRATLGRALRQAEHAMWEAEVVEAIGKAATIVPAKRGGQPGPRLDPDDEPEPAAGLSVDGGKPASFLRTGSR